MNQMEEHCDTKVVLTTKSIKPSIAKIEEPFHSEKDQPTKNHEITPSRLIIKSKKILKNRKPLSIALLISTNYSCGCSLKSLSFQQKQDTPFQVVRVNRFPNTIFEINQTTEKCRNFVLISNFLGTKYNLYEEKQNLMTISFTAGFCNNSSSRQFSIYLLAKNTSYSQLKKMQDGQDLQEIYSFTENEGKISKFSTLQPRRSLENGELHLNFAKKHVVPAVQNAIVADATGQQALQIVKLGQNQFEVSFKDDLPKHYGAATGIASLDFKWAIQ